MSEETTNAAKPEEKIGGIETFGVKAPAKDGKEERSLQVSFDFGKDLNEAVAKFGKDAIFSGFIASAKVDAQAFLRRKLAGPKEKIAADPEKGIAASETQYTDEEILKEFEGWKPGTKTRTSADPVTKVMAALGKLSDEQKAALLASLKG